MSGEWSEMVDEEENSLPEDSHKVEPEQKHSHCNEIQSIHEKERLEEELTKLVLVTAHNKNALQEMAMHTQDADDEIRLCLALVRADLKGKRNEPTPRREILNWGVMGQRILATLMQLEVCQDSVKLPLNYQSIAENLGSIFTLVSRQGKPPIKCHYCKEAGHIKRDCPHRINKEKWMQTAAFKRKTELRQELNEAKLAGKEKLWPEIPDSGEKEQDKTILAEQDRIENARVSHNPL